MAPADLVRRARSRQRRLRRVARRRLALHRTIVVPLLGHEESEEALHLACRLAADHGSRLLVLAPLAVPAELPLDAFFETEETELRAELHRARAIAESYGVGCRTRVVRTRNFGRDAARWAEESAATLIVVGAPILSRRGFHHAFPRAVEWLLRDAPCRVLIATGAYVAGRA